MRNRYYLLSFRLQLILLHKLVHKQSMSLIKKASKKLQKITLKVRKIQKRSFAETGINFNIKKTSSLLNVATNSDNKRDSLHIHNHRFIIKNTNVIFSLPNI